MEPLQTDLSVFKKLNLEKPPVGVKYLLEKPEGIKQLDKKMALCEMVTEAQKSKEPFYMTRENEICFGAQALGMVSGAPSAAASGELGVRFEIFRDAQANRNLFKNNPNMEKGIVNYVVFAPLEKITFEPDLLILMTDAKQAEITLRSMTYSTGVLYESMTSTALSCAWLYVYPYVSGKVNYFLTGLGFGSIGRKAYEPGWVLIAIPRKWLPTMVQNLKEMKWELASYTLGREEFDKWEKGIQAQLMRESRNH